MSLKNVSVPLLGVGAAAAVFAAVSLTRKRTRARRSAAKRMLAGDLLLFDTESEPSQLDPEDLQWRPPIRAPLAGPEDLEPLELDFDEIEETDLAAAAITVDLVGPERERTEAPGETGELPIAENEEEEREERQSDSDEAREVDDLDWRDELETDEPPHRYR